jgi:hypothetical protein
MRNCHTSLFGLKKQPEPVVPNLRNITLSLLAGNPTIPFTLKQINDLPENIKMPFQARHRAASSTLDVTDLPQSFDVGASAV